jgi:hypothetical protein
MDRYFPTRPQRGSWLPVALIGIKKPGGTGPPGYA